MKMRNVLLLPLVLFALVVAGCSDPVSVESQDAQISGPLASVSQDAMRAAQSEFPADRPTQTIVEVALAVNAESGEFSSLIAAVVKADLVDALSAKGAKTVFAPTDAAFASLLAELGASSLDDISVETLTSVLLYHVAPGRRFSGRVLGAKTIPTLNGDKIGVKEGTATLVDVNGREANILVDAGLFDIAASNGVIHVIDRVILPTL